MPRRSTSPTRINLQGGYWLDCREASTSKWFIYWNRTAEYPTRGKRGTGQTTRAGAETYFHSVFLPEAQAIASRKRDGDPRWDDLLDWYENEKRHEGKRQTVFDNCKMLRRAVSGLHVSETNGAFWERYKSDRRNGAYSFYKVQHPRQKNGLRASDGTLIKELSCMKAVLRLGIAAQRVRPELMPSFRMPKPPPPKSDHLNDAEARELLDKALALSPPEGQGKLRRVTLLVHLLLWTGGRKRAVELLTWDRVDWQTSTINLQSPDMTQNDQKKNAKVPIVEWLRPVLERAYRERTNKWVLGNSSPTWRVWTQFRDKHYAGAGLSRHMLRHTIATKLLNDGASLEEVAAFIGDTVRTTERIYINGDKTPLARGVLNSVKPL
jgi:integrase